MEYSFLPTLTPLVTALSLLSQDNATNSSDSMGKKKKKSAVFLSDLGYLPCTYICDPLACS